MANQLLIIMNEDDERSFLKALESHHLVLYPRLVPPGYTPLAAKAATWDNLPGNDLYLTADRFGPLEGDTVKRGPHRGDWRVDERQSPVIFWERCVRSEGGELIGGQIWAEVVGDTKNGVYSREREYFRQTYVEVATWFRSTCRRGRPQGYLIGPAAAREMRQLTLRCITPDHRPSRIELA